MQLNAAQMFTVWFKHNATLILSKTVGNKRVFNRLTGKRVAVKTPISVEETSW